MKHQSSKEKQSYLKASRGKGNSVEMLLAREEKHPPTLGPRNRKLLLQKVEGVILSKPEA